MKYLFFLLFSSATYSGADAQKQSSEPSRFVTLTKQILKDKIRGGWAGQTIGVTFGGPYEFRFNGTFIQDYQPLVWYDGYIKKTMQDIPGLYDDLYMDITFVDVFEKYGFNAPVDSFANAFARAGYELWHANQSARFNILQGIKAPESGHWQNNPHADDIDYQIESDYAGLMSPGMPNTASSISDKIGHIMNYGDGWYGGVFVGAMYSVAFISKDVKYIVNEALRTIPKQSLFYQCIADVIRWHKRFPSDWHQTWFEIQKKWSSDIGCTEGVFLPFNIDAKINAAYIVLGLLYGNGDFTKTMHITTRAGQDADCNPSSAGGILGTMMGYSEIPDYWKQGLKDAEDIPFKYTTLSLNQVYDISYVHALSMITRNGGQTDGDRVIIPIQSAKAVRFEQSFPDMFPGMRVPVPRYKQGYLEFSFTGTGFVLIGRAVKKNKQLVDTILEADIFVDGVKLETARLPTNYHNRRNEITWKYHLTDSNHKVEIRWAVHENLELQLWEYIWYDKVTSKAVNLHKPVKQ